MQATSSIQLEVILTTHLKSNGQSTIYRRNIFHLGADSSNILLFKKKAAFSIGSMHPDDLWHHPRLVYLLHRAEFTLPAHILSEVELHMIKPQPYLDPLYTFSCLCQRRGEHRLWICVTIAKSNTYKLLHTELQPYCVSKTASRRRKQGCREAGTTLPCDLLLFLSFFPSF